jgi:hypothetical protein
VGKKKGAAGSGHSTTAKEKSSASIIADLNVIVKKGIHHE